MPKLISLWLVLQKKDSFVVVAFDSPNIKYQENAWTSVGHVYTLCSITATREMEYTILTGCPESHDHKL